MDTRTDQSDASLELAEEQIPELAAQAVRQAYTDALAAGQTVLVAEAGFLIEVSPDGGRRIVKPLPRHVSIGPRRVIFLK
jgi:hypothetical protein